MSQRRIQNPEVRIQKERRKERTGRNLISSHSTPNFFPFLFWLLASGFWLQDSFAQEPFSLEAQGKIETRGEANSPYIIMEGKTNLPDRAILRTSIYYDRIALDQELNSRRDLVRDGAFQVSAEANTGIVFPGLYMARIVFDPTDQYQEIQNLLGPDPKNRTWDIPFRIGTETEAKEAQAKARQELIDTFNTLYRVQKEIHEIYTRMMKKFDQKVWNDHVQHWRSEIETAAHPKTPPTVLKILSLADVPQHHLEDMTETLDQIISLSTAGLAAPKKNPAQWNQLNRSQYGLKAAYDAAMRRLGVVVVKDEDIRRRHQQVVQMKNDLMQTYEQYARSTLSTEEWEKSTQDWMTNFFTAVLALTEIAPEFTNKKASEILQAGQNLFAEVMRADHTPGNPDRLKPFLAPFDKATQDFLALLEGTYVETELPPTQTPHGGHGDPKDPHKHGDDKDKPVDKPQEKDHEHHQHDQHKHE